MLSLLYLGSKAEQCFVSLSCMFLDKKTLLKIGLNPGLKLTIFRGTEPRCESMHLTKVNSLSIF